MATDDEHKAKETQAAMTIVIWLLAATLGVMLLAWSLERAQAQPSAPAGEVPITGAQWRSVDLRVAESAESDASRAVAFFSMYNREQNSQACELAAEGLNAMDARFAGYGYWYCEPRAQPRRVEAE